MTRIITLGSCCRIVTRLESTGMKQKSSLVDWMKSDDFDDVLSVLRSVVDGKYNSFTYERRGKDMDLYLNDTNIRSLHYAERFKSTFDRRALRFIEDITTSKHVLFIRDNGDGFDLKHYTDLCDIVKLLNPDCVFDILVTYDAYRLNNFEFANVPENLHMHVYPEDDNDFVEIVKMYM